MSLYNFTDASAQQAAERAVAALQAAIADGGLNCGEITEAVYAIVESAIREGLARSKEGADLVRDLIDRGQ